MIIGVPKEIKGNERRVALTPIGAETLGKAGHSVTMEEGAGAGSGFADQEYTAAGARLESDQGRVWDADLVLKVKEPLPSEYGFFRPGLLLFTFLHLAAEPELTRQLIAKRVTAIAYETIEAADGSLPILTPMSEVAGRMAPQIAAHELTHMRGGRGILLGGVPGTAPAQVVILGAGTVGSNAARIAIGMGAEVTLINRGIERLRQLDVALNGRLVTLAASPPVIARALQTADAVIGAALVAGARAPILVSEEMVKSMRPGSVIVDVAVDQGGCVETIRPTSHTDPTYIVHGVVHYAVPNMPGAVPHTSTIALCNVTLPYVLRLANDGFVKASQSPAIAAGVNTHDGAVTHPGVAEALGLSVAPSDALGEAH